MLWQNYELLEEGGKHEYNVTIFEKFFSCSYLQIHKIEDFYNPLVCGFNHCMTRKTMFPPLQY